MWLTTHSNRLHGLRAIALLWWPFATVSVAEAAAQPGTLTSIFAPETTPAHSIFNLSMLVLAITAVIFVVVGSLLVYAIVKFRSRPEDEGREPPQVYGSTQIELAWTIIPILIVVVLFMATARVIHAVQDPKLPGALEVTVVGHQFCGHAIRSSDRDRQELHILSAIPAV